MRQCFCDCCGQQQSESNLTNMNVNDFKVDLCYKCQATLVTKLENARNEVEVEFMKTMKHQPLAFKYCCR